jgi:hypothetical protein
MHYLTSTCQPEHFDRPKFFRLDLNETQSTELLDAKQVLVKILEYETLFDNLLESYTAFKATLYSKNLQLFKASMSMMIDKRFMHETISDLNRLVFNVLNFSKLYLDKHYHKDQDRTFALKITGNREIHKLVIEHYDQESKLSRDFQFGKFLRNFSQHSVPPIQPITYGFTRDKKVHFSLPVDIEALKKDKNYKKVSKLFQGEDIDLHTILDGYIFLICRFHELNRTLVKERQSSAILIYEKFNTLMEQECNCKGSVRLNDSDSDRASSLDPDWYQVIDYLVLKNTKIRNWSDIEFIQYPIK